MHIPSGIIHLGVT